MKQNYYSVSLSQVLLKNLKSVFTGSMVALLLVFGLSYSTTTIFAQGETCGAPITISSLPFTEAGDIADYGDNYGQSDRPELGDEQYVNGTGSESYLNGPEVVYAYTPTENEIVTVSMTNDNGWAALWVFEGCPFSSIVARHTSTTGTSRELPDLNFTSGTTYYIVISNWDPGSMNYNLVVTKLQDCSGTPDAGTVSDVVACLSTGFTLTTQGASFGASGLEYQWETSTDGTTWTDIPGANQSTHLLASGVTEEGYYRLTVSCANSGESDTSDAIHVTLDDPLDCYCVPTGGGNNGDEIVNFSISGTTLDNSSAPSETNTGTAGYSDYTTTIAPALLIPGQAYVATLTSGGGSGTHAAAIWIDWNDNGVFETTEKVAIADGISGSATISFPSFLVPDAPGQHRLRVQYHYDKTADLLEPCVLTSTFSEVEDYMIEVPTGDACSGTPEAGVATVTPAIGNPGSAFTVGVTNGDYAADYEYQWQSSEDGGATWVDIPGANEATYNGVAGYDLGTTEYRRVTTCPNSSETVYSDPGSFTTQLVYCNPAYSSGCGIGSQINGVTTTGAIINFSNTGTGCGNGGYSDYTATHSATVVPGTNFNLKVDIANYSGYVKAWVDWNGNGTFEADELVINTSSSILAGQTVTETVTVPVNAVEGTTRMRVRTVESVSSFDACSSQSHGEGEDYSIVIGEAPSCMPPSDLFVYNITETSATLEWTDNAGALQWNVEYGEAGFTQGTGTMLNNVTDNPLDITLVPDTEYEFYVQAICGDDDDSYWSGPYFFSNTYCKPEVSGAVSYYITEVKTEGAVTNLNRTSTAGTNGYSDFTSDTLRAYPGQTITVSLSHNTSTHAYRVWVDWGKDYVFNEPEDVIYTTGSSYVSSPNTFTLTIPTDAPEVTTTMRVRNAYLSAVDLSPCHEFTYGETEDYTIQIVEVPTCLPPTNLMVTAVDETSITIEWDEVNSANEWTVSYYEDGDEENVTTVTTTNNPYTITGLNDDTKYNVSVSSNCDENDQSYFTTVNGVRTDCNPMVAVGYCESFEDIEDLSCWRVINNNQDDRTWAIYNDATFANTGTGVAGLYTDGKSGAMDDYLVLPRMTLTGNEVLSFAYRARSASEPNDVRVVLSTTGSLASDFTEEVMELMVVSNTVYEDTTIDLSAYTGDVFIAFHVPQGGLDGWYIYIDDVCIDVCVPEPGINGSTEVCRLDAELNLLDVITSDYTHGDWIFPANQSLIDGNTLNTTSLPAGSYEALYVVQGGCTADTTVATIDVFGPSSAGIGGTITVCKNSAINLYDGLSGNVDMGGDWYDFNDNLLPNSQPTSPNFGGSYNYTYVTSNNVCPADTAFIEVIVDANCTSSIDEVEFADVTIYPNPTADVINILNPSSTADLKLEVLDVNGRVVLVEDKALSNTTKTTISLEGIVTGVYTLRIYNDGGQKTFKVVKQ